MLSILEVRPQAEKEYEVTYRWSSIDGKGGFATSVASPDIRISLESENVVCWAVSRGRWRFRKAGGEMLYEEWFLRRSTRFGVYTCLLSFSSFLREKEVFQILDYAHVRREDMGGVFSSLLVDEMSCSS